MGRDHKLSIDVTLCHVDLCTRLEIYLRVVGANFPVLVYTCISMSFLPLDYNRHYIFF